MMTLTIRGARLKSHTLKLRPWSGRGWAGQRVRAGSHKAKGGDTPKPSDHHLPTAFEVEYDRFPSSTG